VEYDHASLFNYATATTVCAGADGLALASASHTLAAVPGTTVSNYTTSALSSSAIENALIAFRKMVDDQNLLVSVEPSVLLVPPDLEFDAHEILNSSGKPYTADNEINAIKGRLQIKTWDFLTNTDRWFILASNKEAGPISYNRVPISFDRGGDFDTGDLKMKSRTRYSFGFTDWRWAYVGAPT
jgi:hypothetical protein